MEKADQKQIADDIYDAADDQDKEGAFGITEGTEDSGHHIIEGHGPDTGEVNLTVTKGHGIDFGRNGHDMQEPWGQKEACNGADDAKNNRKGIGGVNGTVQIFFGSGAKVTGDDNSCTGREAGEEIQRKFE